MNSKKNKSVLIMAGGTGGHVFPGLALAEEMQQRGYQINWLGTQAGIETRLVPAADIPLHFIPVKGVRGKGIKSLLVAPLNIVSSIVSAFRVIRELRPSVVVGLGGFVAGPGGIAARLLGIPLVIHEQNAVAGTTNKILASLAKRVLMAFPCNLKNGICIGNPVRRVIESLEHPDSRLQNRKNGINILIVGGSRGAQAINELIPAALGKLDTTTPINIWHQAGAEKDKVTREAYQQARVDARVEAFIDDMAEALAWADIAICRSGALTVSELAAVGLGALLIPFPYAIDDHQTENAKYLEKVGAAIIKQQRELTVASLTELFNNNLFDRDKLVAMARKARSVAKPNAAKTFADHCEEVVYG